MNDKKNTPFWDSSLPVEKRLDWLLSEMTIEEKLGCLSSRVPDLDRLGIPAMNVGGEAAHGVEARNDQNELGEPEPTTSFVQPIGMSATWDPCLIRMAGEVTGKEARVIYHRHPDRGLSRWAPTVDLERDPRWGRTEEGYGEDPFLTGEMASAYIQGMQGENSRYLRVAATLKHFYGNNTEVGRSWRNSSIDPRNKYELYMEPFRKAIEKGGAEAVMTAYNKINGIPGMLNHEVLDILKNQYGLKHAVCDGGAMEFVAGFHHYFGTHTETLAAAIKAGVDAMSDNPVVVEQAAREAWELGILTEQEIDQALRNMFRTKLRLGVYDRIPGNPFDMVTEEDIDSVGHRNICHRVSREAIVLLKNDKNILPLNIEGLKNAALIGPMADVWYPDWYGGTPPLTSTLKEGIETVTDQAPTWTDGLDRVTFCQGRLGIAVGDDGVLYMGENPDIFIMEDWGQGSITFRCERTGKYMNTRFNPEKSGEVPGRIAAERDSVLDWFVLELFGLISQEDGRVILVNRFDTPIQVKEDKSLWASKDSEGTPLTMNLVRSGMDSAKKMAQEKETVILALGCNSMINAKEEVDRETIMLPSDQEKLAETILSVNKNVIVVLFSNYPYGAGIVNEKASAILWSATGAQDMGLAMAETLVGINKPAGRLNLTWYRDDAQLPDINDYDIIKGGRTYRYFTGEVLYPFGFGLTYSDFVYSDLHVSLEKDTVLNIRFAVTNQGSCVSDEVAQVYGTGPASRVKKPMHQLIGFQRLAAVQPGECRRVVVTVPVDELVFYDVISRRLMVEKGTYTITVGPSSAQPAQQVRVDIPGQTPGYRDICEKIPADHYDDYENMFLTQGHLGYCAVTLKDTHKAGRLVYGNCTLTAGDTTAAVLHMRCMSDSCVEIAVNDTVVSAWKGNTREYSLFPAMGLDKKRDKDQRENMATWKPMYMDVRIPVKLPHKENEPFTLALNVKGPVELCYFRMEA